MKCFITGATGFIGSHLLRHLQKKGHDCTISLQKTSNTWRIKDCKVKKEITNLANYTETLNLLKKLKPDAIFHLAGYGVYPTQQDSQKMFEGNFLTTLNLVKACTELNLPNLVYVGSGFEYGFTDKPIKESEPLKPKDPYSITKAAASSLVLSSGYCVGRLFLVYGPKEASTRLIQLLISSYSKNISPQLSSPHNVRDFIFVEDAVHCLEKIAQKGRSGEAYNIGSGKQHSVGEIDAIVRKLLKTNIKPTWNVGAKRTFEPKNWVADISKAKKDLNWEPKSSIQSGILRCL